MDHSDHTRLTEAELTADTVKDAKIYGPDNDTVGTVSHAHDMGSGLQVVVDVGGFLGLGSKSVSLDARQLDFMRDSSGTVHAVTSMTKDQLKDMPEHTD